MGFRFMALGNGVQWGAQPGASAPSRVGTLVVARWDVTRRAKVGQGQESLITPCPIAQPAWTPRALGSSVLGHVALCMFVLKKPLTAHLSCSHHDPSNICPAHTMACHTAVLWKERGPVHICAGINHDLLS